MRSATSSDVPAVRRIMAEAFHEDPLLRWVFPSDEHRLEMTGAWLGVFVEVYVASGRVDVLEMAEEVVAVAIWRMPDQPVQALPGTPTVMGLLAAFVGAEWADSVGRGLQAFTTAQPEPPFAYLHFLAVAPSHQGQGLGTQVLRPGLQAAGAAGLGVELETTSERNLAFYRALGFGVTKTFVLEPGGPAAWSMWRDPSEF